MDNRIKIQEIRQQARQITSLLWVLSEALGSGNMEPRCYEDTAILLANMSEDLFTAAKELEVKLNGEQAQG